MEIRQHLNSFTLSIFPHFSRWILGGYWGGPIYLDWFHQRKQRRCVIVQRANIYRNYVTFLSQLGPSHGTSKLPKKITGWKDGQKHQSKSCASEHTILGWKHTLDVREESWKNIKFDVEPGHTTFGRQRGEGCVRPCVQTKKHHKEERRCVQMDNTSIVCVQRRIKAHPRVESLMLEKCASFGK